MKNEIIKRLKSFVQYYLQKNKLSFPAFNEKDVKELDKYIIWLRYLLNYSVDEKLDIDYPDQSLMYNDQITNIYYKDTDEYNNLIVSKPKLLPSIKEFKMYRDEQIRENEFLDTYYTYIFDENENIICHKVFVASKYLRIPINVQSYNILQPIEYFDTNTNANEITKNLTGIMPNGKYFSKNIDLIKIAESTYAEKVSYANGVYETLNDLRVNQTRTYVLNLNKKSSILSQENVNNLLRSFRNNISAHNHLYTYSLKGYPHYIGNVLHLEEENIVLILPNEIFVSILRGICVLNYQKIDETSIVFYNQNTEKATEANISKYIKQCKLVNIKFKEKYSENAIYSFLINYINKNYYKLSKDEKNDNPIDKYLYDKLSEHFKISKIEVVDLPFTQKIEEFIKNKIACNDIITLKNVGETIDNTLFTFGDNIVKKSKCFGPLKDYLFKPNKIALAHLLRRFNSLLHEKNINGFKNIEKQNNITKDMLIFSIILLITYINIVNNEYSDNLESKFHNNNFQNKKLIESLFKDESMQKRFVFSEKGNVDHIARDYDECIQIIKMIRNSLSHGNFTINYTSSGKLNDANIYFLSDPKKGFNNERFKLICKVSDFVNFISSDYFTKYSLPNKNFEATTFDELLNIIRNNFNK